MWATRVTSGARPVLVDAGGRRGRRRQEEAQERVEDGDVAKEDLEIDVSH